MTREMGGECCWEVQISGGPRGEAGPAEHRR